MHKKRVFTRLLIISFLALIPGKIFALESPHALNQGTSCLSCHILKKINGIIEITVPRYTEQETVCKSCHNPNGLASGMSNVGMHVTEGGGTIIECTTCHNPHRYEQSTDPITGSTADNLKLLRSKISEDRVPGVQNPVVYQQPDQYIFTEAPYSGVCQSCHTATSHYTNDNNTIPNHFISDDCTSCHTHEAGFAGSLDHLSAGAVLPLPSCINCHGVEGQDAIESVHNSDCGLCHLNSNGGGPIIEPYETLSPSGGDCSVCHGTMAQIHQNANHTAAPGNGPVVIFADTDHDDAGWIGERPYFDIEVDCNLCHSTDLPSIHGQRCETCHPSPIDSLGTWNGGCGQSACHQTIHENSIPAHWPFENAYNNSGNDCSICHNQSWDVPQSSCLNCHATYNPGDHTPPVTISDTQSTYTGPARIDFSVTDGGKVGVGTTFYRLDDAAELTGSDMIVYTPGSHILEFRSMDQTGNLEVSATEVAFTVIEDTTPPVTASNAYSSYYNGAYITLTAADNSSLGVKTTYYQLNGGPIKTGRTVSVPAVNGVISYELIFWSEDWSGNSELPKSANFTVTSGTVTLRLVWGNSDITGSPCGNDPEAWADWYIRRGDNSGYLVASGGGGCPDWSGVDDVVVSVSPTPYHVSIWWWDSEEGWDDNTTYSSVLANTPGEIIRLIY